MAVVETAQKARATSATLDETETAYTLRFDIGNAALEDLSLELEGNAVVLRAPERRETFQLPVNADAEWIRADYRAGLLVVHVPTLPAPRRRRVEIVACGHTERATLDVQRCRPARLQRRSRRRAS